MVEKDNISEILDAKPHNVQRSLMKPVAQDGEDQPDVRIWEKAKTYLLPYEGSASQIYVLEIPGEHIGEVLERLKTSFRNPWLTMISNEPLNEKVTLNNAEMNETLLKRLLSGQSTIYANIFDDVDIHMDIWPNETDNTFDLEVWFWADQFFPGDDTFNRRRFESFLGILEDMLGEGEYRGVLTPYEASDPRKDLERGHALELNLIK